MNAVALFAASFVVVFALGFQQMNVTARLYPAAFATSIAIGSAQLVQFKYLPGPTSVLDVFGFLLGGATGIVTAMEAHPALMAWGARRVDAASAGVQLEQRDHAEAERIELASEIALDAAIVEIESYCPPFPMGHVQWFDTDNPTSGPGSEPELQASVDMAVRYLELRDRLIHHPQVHSLVRFKS